MNLPIRPAQLKWIVGIIILILLVIVVIFWRLNVQASTATFRSADAHIELNYDSRLHTVPLVEQDRKDKVVLRLREPLDQPEILVTLRYEDGLKPIATATKQPLRDAVVANLTRTYPQRFPKYHIVNSRNLTIDGHDAYEQTFTYQAHNQPIITQRFIVITITDDKASYLALQTKTDGFDNANKAYFDQIVRSLRVQ